MKQTDVRGHSDAGPRPAAAQGSQSARQAFSTAYFIVVVAVAGAVWGCSGGGGASLSARQQAVQRAKDAVGALASMLQAELSAAMKENGAPGAVEYCAANAQRLSKRVADERALSIRRVSLKWRNPADAPDDFERDVLDRFQREQDAGALSPDAIYTDVRTRNGRQVLVLLKPIRIASPCLQCHGTDQTVDPNALRIIHDRYPDDRATGYRTGDLRGAFSVAVDLE